MNTRVHRRKKAQSVLEATLAFAAGSAFLGAVMTLWAIGNAHIPIRQVTYQATRIAAGTPGGRSVSERGAQGGFKPLLYPTYIAKF
ncbi:MAG: hypothetical protein GF333_08015 [Candidatus Omnitrophica bacterium]|nr:hypothetical protein [Candidatus Omnitrophota bacterium]